MARVFKIKYMLEISSSRFEIEYADLQAES